MSQSRAARPPDSRVGKAITAGLDSMADELPELLTMPDQAMLRLQAAFEEALGKALKPAREDVSKDRLARDHSL